MTTCQVCPTVEPHGHDKHGKPVLEKSRVRAHGELGTVEELTQFNATVRYHGRGRVYPVKYSLLEVIEVDDPSPTAQAAGKLTDAFLLVKQAIEILPVRRLPLTVLADTLQFELWEIEHAEQKS